MTINNDLFIVNGCHDPEKLQNLLYSLIKKFVLCTKCNNPETNLIIRDGKIGQKCIACGHDTVIPKSIHKITTFIINHPPEGVVASKRDKAGSKTEKRSKKHGNSSSPTNNVEKEEDQFLKGNDSDQFDDDELTTDAYSERMRELCEGLNNGNIMRDAKESANIFFKFVKGIKVLCKTPIPKFINLF